MRKPNPRELALQVALHAAIDHAIEEGENALPVGPGFDLEDREPVVSQADIDAWPALFWAVGPMDGTTARMRTFREAGIGHTAGLEITLPTGEQFHLSIVQTHPITSTTTPLAQ